MSRPQRARSPGPSVASDLGPIVSSAHLATGLMPALSELEFGLILLGHAFNRWMVRCAAAAGIADLSALDVLV
ncbi:MAG TPA: transcriptional regulator, partial [Xanthobacteraceae bacterium]|nr:transcriptional regulator [Xanthobacteraceae bacterium]